MPDVVVGFRGRGLTRFVAGATGVINNPNDPGDDGGGGVGPGPGPIAGWGGVQSPTGRNPLFIANSARQAVWNQMYADYLANPSSPATRGGVLAKQVRQAALDGPGVYYASIGQYATYMYQMTGQQTWCDLAYSQIQGWLYTIPPFPGGMDANTYRNWLPDHIIMLDWLWPGLTPAQRTTFHTTLVNHVNGMNTGYGWASLAVSGDSDQVLGHYLITVLMYLFDPTNVTIAGWYNAAPTGGLDATASNHSSTLRNSIKQFFEMAAGGEFIESSEYNLRTIGHSTVPLIEAVLTATGVEHFPEYRAWLESHAKMLLNHMVPDLSMGYQWGDEEAPYEALLNDWSNTGRTLSGVLQGTVLGEQMHAFVIEEEGKWGLENGSTTSFEPFQPGTWFEVYNPYAPSQEWKTDTNKRTYASGKGMLLFKTGYTISDSLFAVDSGQWLQDSVQGSWWCHHLVEYFMHFMHWKNGEWVLKVPFGYNGVGIKNAGMNVPLMHGINGCIAYRRVQHEVHNATYAYLCGTTGGAMQDKAFDLPNDNVCVHEWTRSLTHFPGLTDVVVCYDRADVRAIVNINNYRSQMSLLCPRQRIEGGSEFGFPVPAPLHRKQLFLHTQVSPTIGGQEISWTTPGGQLMKATQLFPASTTKTIRNEASLAAGLDFDWKDSAITTRAYHVVIYPTVTQDWDTFLQAIYCGGTPGVVVSKSNGGWEGVHGTRPGQEDFLVLHNATQAPALTPLTPHHANHPIALAIARYRNVGCTIAWTAVGANTLVRLNDLDPLKSWTINKDGAGAVALSVDSGGHAAYTAAGAGAHSLVLA